MIFGGYTNPGGWELAGMFADFKLGTHVNLPLAGDTLDISGNGSDATINLPTGNEWDNTGTVPPLPAP